MAYDFSGFGDGIFGGIDRSRKERVRREDLDRSSATRAEDQHLAERREMKADEQQDYTRRKDLGFEGSGDPAEAAFRARMKKKEDLAARTAEADIAYKNRMPQDRPDPAARGEQAVGEKIKAIGLGIADIDEREEENKKWYLPAFFEDKLSKEDTDLREQLKARRLGILGVGGGQPAPDRRAIYMKARNEGKSEAEARALAGG